MLGGEAAFTARAWAPTSRADGEKQTVFFQDGPYMSEPKDVRGFKKIATYQNGDIAAARYHFGSGIVVLTGPNPEADGSWFREAVAVCAALVAQSVVAALLGVTAGGETTVRMQRKRLQMPEKHRVR